MVLSGIRENIPRRVIVYHEAEGWVVYIYSSGIFSCIPRSTIVWGICLIPRMKCYFASLLLFILIFERHLFERYYYYLIYESFYNTIRFFFIIKNLFITWNHAWNRSILWFLQAMILNYIVLYNYVSVTTWI